MAPPTATDRQYRRRFWSRVHKTPNGCWEWTAGTNSKGYGYFHIDGRTIQAYKVADDWKRGELPNGMERHHACENRLCVRPHKDHVVRMTVREHRLTIAGSFIRQNVDATHCPQGHPYDNANTFRSGSRSRRCRECSRQYRRDARARAKGRYRAL